MNNIIYIGTERVRRLAKQCRKFDKITLKKAFDTWTMQSISTKVFIGEHNETSK